MKRGIRWGKKVFAGTAVLLFAGISAVLLTKIPVGYVPSGEEIVKPPAGMSGTRAAFDVWGRTVSEQEAAWRKKTPEGRRWLSPQNGAVAIDETVLRLGREAFYKETFGNEVFLTDIMGLTHGALTLPNIMKALIQLHGRGTTNLQVELARTVTLGGHPFAKGTKIDTGIDVPKGSYLPLGMPVILEHGRPRIGISCAACHAAVDRNTGKVVEGAPNADLNAGLLMALATNSAAYFTHTNITSLQPFVDRSSQTVPTTDGHTAYLPNPKKLEDAVDAILLQWPRGNFDSTIDLQSNPAQIPDAWTSGDHPYGWSGFAAAGPFHGLSSFSNNVHAQNSDSLSQADASKALFGIDKEVYLGTILQNAAHPRYRFRPDGRRKPSAFFASVDPTPGSPGVNQLVQPPSYPKLSLVAPDGLIASSPGHRFMEQVNAMSAWQNTLEPPAPPFRTDPVVAAEGRAVFVRAGCVVCHAGAAMTNHRVIPANVIGTEPSRARALKKTEAIFGESFLYTFDTPVPVPQGARILRVPTSHLDPGQIQTSYAHGGSSGGYKVPSLIGLYRSAPYLHDGGVAVGADPDTQLGIPGTLGKGVMPDPANSLRALIDRDLRRKVVAANRASKALQTVHVQGTGHEFWVDPAAGFTPNEQEALIRFLLAYHPNTATEKRTR
jgi:hypothetical protein